GPRLADERILEPAAPEGGERRRRLALQAAQLVGGRARDGLRHPFVAGLDVRQLERGGERPLRRLEQVLVAQEQKVAVALARGGPRSRAADGGAQEPQRPGRSAHRGTSLAVREGEQRVAAGPLPAARAAPAHEVEDGEERHAVLVLRLEEEALVLPAAAVVA